MSELLGIISGICGGFISSWFFWNQEKKKDIPRLELEIATLNYTSLVRCNVINIGFSHALDVVILDAHDNIEIERFIQIGPDQHKIFLALNGLIDEEQIEVFVNYKDVWGKSYSNLWRISAPYEEDFPLNDGGGKVERIPFHAEVRFLK
jgi:hypothetical protein